MIGQTLGHYRIVAKLGAGGMGEVYRAHDEQLDRDVALKVLPAGTLADEAARNRFRKEALALAKLNHPNIETVYEFSSQGGVDFLAMELIRGSLLSEKLKKGPLPETEISRLGTQFAEGLAAAHEQGVVHRDLKPGNLMITLDGRLKILDFGLAKLVHPTQDTDVTRSMATETGTVSGTVPYMSPEQLRGEPIDERSDIYAAGAVLYEMATSRRPFPQTHGPTLMGAILHEPPARPSSVNRRVTTVLESVVMKALDKDPARRYQSAHELLVALEGVGAGAAPRAARSRWPLVATGSVALSVMLLLGVIFGLNVGGLRDRLLRGGSTGKEAAGPSTAPIKVRRSAAVLGFKNLSGRPDEAWLSTALSEMFTTELAAGEQLRTIPGENVARTKLDLSLTDEDGYAPDTLARIRKNLGSDLVVVGSYLALGEKAGRKIRLDVRLQNTSAGETIATESATGTEAELLDLVSRAGARLRQKLGVGEISAAEASAVRASLPSKPEAARLYSEGLAKLRVFDALTARGLLEKAVAADPEYSLAHSALSSAWSRLGYDEKAKTEGKRAFELSTNLSREERLLVEARYRETTREREKAVEIYHTLWRFFPDNLDYGLQLAAAQTFAGKGSNALATVEALRKLPLPAAADPRIDLAESNAAQSLSDFKRAQTAAERAAAGGKAQGMRLLVARAQISEGWAFYRLGKMDQATLAFENARQIHTAAGDRGGAADASSAMGKVFWQRGDLSKAEEIHKQALAIWREMGNKVGVATSLNDLANVRYSQYDLPGAKKYYEDSLAIQREIGNRRGVAVGLNNVGAVLYLQGNPTAAKKMYEEALAIQREIGDQRSVAMALHNIAEVLSSQPDLPGAKRMYEEALAIRRDVGDRSGAASTLKMLGGVLYNQADIAGAKKKLEEALAIQNELGEKGSAAVTRGSLAAVLTEEGQAVRAETLAREAAEEFQAERVIVSEASARAVLAQALLAQGKLAEAQKAIARATELLGKSDNRDARLSALITAARVRAVSGEAARAAKSLEAVLAEATKFRLVDTEFEARLALGEIEMKSDKGAGRARLAALEKEATAKGFLLLAGKAHATASK